MDPSPSKERKLDNNATRQEEKNQPSAEPFHKRMERKGIGFQNREKDKVSLGSTCLYA